MAQQACWLQTALGRPGVPHGRRLSAAHWAGLAAATAGWQQSISLYTRPCRVEQSPSVSTERRHPHAEMPRRSAAPADEQDERAARHADVPGAQHAVARHVVVAKRSLAQDAEHDRFQLRLRHVQGVRVHQLFLDAQRHLDGGVVRNLRQRGDDALSARAIRRATACSRRGARLCCRQRADKQEAAEHRGVPLLAVAQPDANLDEVVQRRRLAHARGCLLRAVCRVLHARQARAARRASRVHCMAQRRRNARTQPAEGGRCACPVAARHASRAAAHACARRRRTRRHKAPRGVAACRRALRRCGPSCHNKRPLPPLCLRRSRASGAPWSCDRPARGAGA